MNKSRLLQPDCFKLEHQIFLAFELKMKHCLFLGPAAFGLEFTPSALLILRPSDLD